jgi:hypothetical protein
MNKVDYVLAKLRPEGGYAIWDNDFDTIRWDDDVIPLTRKEFDDALLNVDQWQAQDAAAKQAEAEAKATARQAILDRLGLTADEAALLLG